MRFHVRAWFALVITSSLCVAGWAKPVVRQVTPRGLKLGTTTTLTIEGADLAAEPRLLLAGLPSAQQTVKPGASPKRIQIDVTLDGSAPAGIYLLRLATNHGVSRPEPIAVSTLPEATLTPRVDALPVALTGSISGSAQATVAFNGHAGQRIVADVMARRLGAAIDPDVRLLDARGRQVAWSPSTRALGGDARAQCVLPADGEYRVEMHDALYRAGDPGQFRLCLGDLTVADFVYPLAVERGHTAELELVSTTLGADRARVPFNAAGLSGLQPVGWPDGVAAISGGQAVVCASPYPAVIETAGPDGVCELPPPPLTVSARFAKPKSKGVFRLPVEAGKRYRVEVFAERLGLPVDAVLNVENERGGQVANNDDRMGTKDPSVDFTAPGGEQRLLIKTQDLYGAGGPDHLYRLVITKFPAPDFALSIAGDALEAPRGGAGLARFSVKRNGYAGPVKLKADGLPAGWTIAPDEIPKGVDQAMVSILSAADSPIGASAASLVTIHGETVGVDPPVVWPAMALNEERAPFSVQPWLRSQLAAASLEPGRLEVAWAPWSADATLIAGGSLPIEVDLKRADGAAGPIRVQLLTSQIVPKKTVKVKNIDQQVDAVERTVRLEAPIEVAADQSHAKGTLIVPGDLALLPYDLVIEAELLNADKKTVMATAYAPVRRLMAAAPMKLELAGPAEAQGRAGAGEAGQLSGKLVRTAGFNAPVKIQLTGLPKDVVSPSVTLTGDKTEFTLPLSFAFGVAAGPVKDVKLVATSVPAGKLPKDSKETLPEARSNEIAVALSIVPGEKPAPPPPRMVFEDQPEFVSALVEGMGQATLFTEDKFSGAASCKVTPDQRYNHALPGLVVKIREKPAAGEYRYLQFAWKKQGGDKICLQLHHDGQWGPSMGKPGKFRYHAGVGAEPYGASLKVADALPAGFTLVTRDLFADFGEFTLTGLALSTVDGEFALFDHIYLGQTPEAFDQVKPK